jgi:hypothetical protein
MSLEHYAAKYTKKAEALKNEDLLYAIQKAELLVKILKKENKKREKQNKKALEHQLQIEPKGEIAKKSKPKNEKGSSGVGVAKKPHKAEKKVDLGGAGAKNSISATKKVMELVLTKNKIQFSKNLKKAELEQLIRSNNLVRQTNNSGVA